MRKGDTFEWWACSACGVLGEDEHEECCEGARQERRAYVAVDALLRDDVIAQAAKLVPAHDIEPVSTVRFVAGALIAAALRKFDPTDPAESWRYRI